ncbi:unnamed protein product, partial [Choristocarpus tenellus]
RFEGVEGVHAKRSRKKGLVSRMKKMGTHALRRRSHSRITEQSDGLNKKGSVSKGCIDDEDGGRGKNSGGMDGKYHRSHSEPVMHDDEWGEEGGDDEDSGVLRNRNNSGSLTTRVAALIEGQNGDGNGHQWQEQQQEQHQLDTSISSEWRVNARPPSGVRRGSGGGGGSSGGVGESPPEGLHDD